MAKSTKGYVILLLIGLTLGAAGAYLYMEGASSPGSRPAAVESDAERKVLYWQAPMDPAYIRNEPGKSPMGMELIPVYEGEEGSASGTVVIDPVTIQNIGVRSAAVRMERLTRTLRTVGRVDYDEKRVYHVNTKLEGWVEKLYVDFTGQEVKKGDYLLEIYSPKLVATQEEYMLARSFVDSGGGGRAPGKDSVLDLAKKRLELWDVPAHQIKELEETGRIKRTIHVHSPAKGIVVNKKVQDGMYVKPGINLYTIADLSKVWVYADLYEYEISWIKLGQEAEITLAPYPGEVFRGKVSFINPFMEPKTRTVKVRIELDNHEGKLKPEMFANVTLKSRSRRATLVVPSEAVLLSGERSIVIVERGAGKFMPTEVTLGLEAEGFYEILDGLEAGETVVTSAHFLIDSESRLNEAITKMLEVDGEMPDRPGMKEPDRSGMEKPDRSGMEKPDHSGMEKMDHGSMEDAN